jgi:hypothetical protein
VKSQCVDCGGSQVPICILYGPILICRFAFIKGKKQNVLLAAEARSVRIRNKKTIVNCAMDLKYVNIRNIERIVKNVKEVRFARIQKENLYASCAVD